MDEGGGNRSVEPTGCGSSHAGVLMYRAIVGDFALALVRG